MISEQLLTAKFLFNYIGFFSVSDFNPVWKLNILPVIKGGYNLLKRVEF